MEIDILIISFEIMTSKEIKKRNEKKNHIHRDLLVIKTLQMEEECI